MIGDGHRHPEEHPKGTSHPFRLPPPPSQLTLNFLLLTCHQEPWFLEINPNGRIPAITHNGQRVFETSAILIYLAQVFDKERKFSQDPAKNLGAWAEEQSWIFFAVSDLLRSLLLQ